MKVLITGASGYLGGFVVERLSSQHELTLFDRVEPTQSNRLRYLQGDVTSYTDVENACAAQDAVVHLVALVRERYDKPHTLFADVMVKGTWNVAEACVKQGVKRLVNVSSIIAVGMPPRREQPYRTDESTHFRPNDLFYCLSKYLGEQIGNAYHQAHGLSIIHIRPGVIAGDGANPGPKLPEDTDKPWFIYVDPRDIAQAVEKALTTDVTFGCYNIVAGRRDSLFDWRSASEGLGYQPEYNWDEIS